MTLKWDGQVTQIRKTRNTEFFKVATWKTKEAGG
jgi:hypothetical protein